MHALTLKSEKDIIAHDAMCRAMDTAGDYWNDRLGISNNLHILQGTFANEILRHYEAVVARQEDDSDVIEEQAADLAFADGFLNDEDHFDVFARTLHNARLHLPEFPLIRYKGGGFSCSCQR